MTQIIQQADNPSFKAAIEFTGWVTLDSGCNCIADHVTDTGLNLNPGWTWAGSVCYMSAKLCI